MKRVLLLAAVAVVFGVAGIFFGHMLALSNQPAIVARNLTHVTIPQVKIETDIGESHAIAELRHINRAAYNFWAETRASGLSQIWRMAESSQVKRLMSLHRGLCLSRFPKMQSSWTMSCDRSNQTLEPTAGHRDAHI